MKSPDLWGNRSAYSWSATYDLSRVGDLSEWESMKLPFFEGG